MRRKKSTIKPTTNWVIVLGLLICSGFLMSSNKIQSTSPLDTIIIEANDYELDILMTVWYDSFHNYQDEGKSMTVADQLACIDGIKKLEDLY